MIALLSVEPSALRPPRPQKRDNSDFDREDRAMTEGGDEDECNDDLDKR